MIRLSRSVVAVGGVVLAAGLITLMSPKTVHALAAALVQVTNTASNPVVTQGVGQQASQIVRLSCTVDQGCFQGGTTYTTPGTGFLVINSVDVFPSDVCSGTHAASLQQFHSEPIGAWLVSGTASTHMTYPSGLVMAPGTSIDVNSSCEFDSFLLVGYLTPN